MVCCSYVANYFQMYALANLGIGNGSSGHIAGGEFPLEILTAPPPKSGNVRKSAS